MEGDSWETETSHALLCFALLPLSVVLLLLVVVSRGAKSGVEGEEESVAWWWWMVEQTRRGEGETTGWNWRNGTERTRTEEGSYAGKPLRM